MQLRVKSAFKVLSEIGYELSDFQDPNDTEEICIIQMSKDNEHDVCILVEKKRLDEFYEEAKKYYDFLESHGVTL